MEFIYYKGLNCYHECVASIANTFGVSCVAAFATLWPETDFRYDPYREIYLSKRMISSLAILGAKAESFECATPGDVAENLQQLTKDALFVAGIDSFYLPWSQFYQLLHGVHYFIAQDTKTDTLPCFDPTYRIKDVTIPRKDLIAHTFDFVRVSPVAKNKLPAAIKTNAAEILHSHPHTRRKLLASMSCHTQEPESIVLLAKYVDALISNRYLYRTFLQTQHAPCDACNWFSDAYFLEWTAVKNGLYKASLIQNREGIMQEVCRLFDAVMEQEIEMAKKI